MSKASEAKIKEYKGEDYTKITFSPDLTKFKMESLDADTIALLSRRAYDVAASTRGVKVFLNGKRIPVSLLYFVLESWMKYVICFVYSLLFIFLKKFFFSFK